MSWIGPTRLLKSLATFALSGSCATIGASAYRARACLYGNATMANIISFRSPRCQLSNPTKIASFGPLQLKLWYIKYEEVGLTAFAIPSFLHEFSIFTCFSFISFIHLLTSLLINSICRVYLVLIFGDFITFYPHLFNEIAWFYNFSLNCA